MSTLYIIGNGFDLSHGLKLDTLIFQNGLKKVIVKYSIK